MCVPCRCWISRIEVSEPLRSTFRPYDPSRLSVPASATPSSPPPAQMTFDDQAGEIADAALPLEGTDTGSCTDAELVDIIKSNIRMAPSTAEIVTLGDEDSADEESRAALKPRFIDAALEQVTWWFPFEHEFRERPYQRLRRKARRLREEGKITRGLEIRLAELADSQQGRPEGFDEELDEAEQQEGEGCQEFQVSDAVWAVLADQAKDVMGQQRGTEEGKEGEGCKEILVRDGVQVPDGIQVRDGIWAVIVDETEDFLNLQRTMEEGHLNEAYRIKVTEVLWGIYVPETEEFMDLQRMMEEGDA